MDQIDVDDSAKVQSNEMTFLEHLEELRWHIIRSLIAIVILTVLAFIAKDTVVDIILGPSRTEFYTYGLLCRLSEAMGLTDALCIEELNMKLINRKMTGQFAQHISVSIYVGIILSFPYIFWESWRFIKPALRKKERRFVRWIVLFGSFLFGLGVLCGYYMMAPISVQFLANYTFIGELENTIDLGSYISLVTMVTLAAALVFELPIIIYFLSSAGLLTPGVMKKYRRHAILVILILSAIITPPDVISQLLLSIPFYILYEISILVSASVNRRREKEIYN